MTFEIDSNLDLVEQENMPFFYSCEEITEKSIFDGLINQSFVDNLPSCELKNFFLIFKKSPSVNFTYTDKIYQLICCNFFNLPEGDWEVDAEVWQDGSLIANYKVTCSDTCFPESTLTLYKNCKNNNNFSLNDNDFMFYLKLLS